MIFDYFARRHPEAVVDNSHVSDIVGSANFLGAGGAFQTRPYAIKKLLSGQSILFENSIGYRVISDKSYSSSLDGLIAPQFIHLFNVLLDYPHGGIYLWPNAMGRRALGYTRAVHTT